MGASIWSGLCECVSHSSDSGLPGDQVTPDTGSTTYVQPTLPCLEVTDEVGEELETWIAMQAGNGDPGEGSAEWEEFIRYLAEQYPEAVVSESEPE
jgi:hypothetical protein